jgi:cytochrome c oxidase assembly factor CtaG
MGSLCVACVIRRSIDPVQVTRARAYRRDVPAEDGDLIEPAQVRGAGWRPTPGVRWALFGSAAAIAIAVVSVVSGLGNDDGIDGAAHHSHGANLAAPTFGRLIAFSWDPWFGVPVVALVAMYLSGVLVLHRRGVHWPLARTACWLLGAITVVACTQTGFADYGTAAFSIHMLQHMTLSMLAPIPLLLAAPVTLALRVIRPAGNGRTGFRELILAVIHSRVARVFAHPVVGAAIFMISIYGLYFTNIFGFLMRSHTGHRVMLAHFILSGLIYFWALISPDPTPFRVPHPIRFLVLVASMPLHAFAGLVMMQQSVPIAQSYYTALHRTWATDLLTDQHWAGGITWSFGEIPTLVLVLVIAAQWARSEERTAKRQDRFADQHPEQDPLLAYNEHLRQLAARSAPRS